MKTFNFSLLFAAAILLSSCGGKNSTSDKNDGSETTEISSESSSTEDWDELLSSYEEYVDEYVSLAKKAAEGDNSAISEYPALLEKAKELGDKLKNAESDMSSSQLEKYKEITEKMAEAAL